MPMYEYRCKKCETHYDHLFSTFAESEDKKELKKVKCPECGSSSKTRLVSCPSFKFAQPEDTDRYRNSHDYRFHHNYNKPGGVKDQREQAEALSHMGSTPYSDTSASDIELDTGIHDVEERPGLT